MPLPMKCPECGADMFLRETNKFKTKDGRPRKFYGCERWPQCKGTHGAHPNGEPLGIPANQETKEWRHKAHVIFDATFNDLTRKNRYKKLQLLMGLAKEDAHIAKFDIERCKQLIQLLSEHSTITYRVFVQCRCPRPLSTVNGIERTPYGSGMIYRIVEDQHEYDKDPERWERRERDREEERRLEQEQLEEEYRRQESLSQQAQEQQQIDEANGG